MSDKDSPGQTHQREAEDKTARQAAEDQREAQRRDAENRLQTAGDAIEAGKDLATRIGTDQTPERADDAPDRQPVDAAADPFPNYAAAKVEELQALAQSRGVEINRDPLKAEIIRKLREADGEAISSGETAVQTGEAGRPYASYDVTPLDQLFKLAEERDVKLDPKWVKAHLITELRAADTSGGVSVQLIDDKVQVTK